MSSFQFESLKLIDSNENDIKLQICITLENILTKILLNPSSNEHRRVDLMSDEVINNLMPFEGGLHSLFELGFIENEDSFFLPKNANLNKIEEFLKQLNFLNKRNIQAPKCESTINEHNDIPNRVDVDTNNMTFQHRSFYSKLRHSFNHVLIYDDKNFQKKALRIIPYKKFKENAKELLGKIENEDISEKDLILIELLNWYKNEFFQWVNKPDCKQCGTAQSINFVENDEPTDIEKNGWAGNVEIYFCSICQTVTRFPRYNNPNVLLDTHCGRCGEWANCFALCLRTLGYETRYVVDWTDHVWCEVYSETQKRWLHIDPCEAALDKPLIYEHGWGKKLSYIMAFSNEEIVDVTWRYSSKHTEVLGRRNECDELWLVKLLATLNKQRQEFFSKNRIEELQRRFLNELVEFVTPKTIKEGEDVGRQSGSLQWRLSRGEMGMNKEQNEKYIFNLNSIEAENLEFSLNYNTAKDVYIRNNEQFKSWSKMAYKYENIQRKIEHDWKMCYLARLEGTNKASIEWYFDFSDHKDLKVDFLQLKCTSSCFEGGQINWVLVCNEKVIKKIDFNNECFAIEKDLKLYNQFILKAELFGGSGSNAFQHTQLFRQKLDNSSEYLFEVIFKFSRV